MGLDMYLYARKFCGFDFHAKSASRPTCVQNNPITKDLVEAGILSTDDYNGRHIRYVEIEIGYWRKVNQVHAWFVRTLADGVDECQKIPVPRVKIAELKALCEAIKADPRVAPDTLPSQSGFFFGSTDCGEWYMQGIDWTLEIIEQVEKLPDGWELYYRASW
jgi:hypothetical protein